MEWADCYMGASGLGAPPHFPAPHDENMAKALSLKAYNPEPLNPQAKPLCCLFAGKGTFAVHRGHRCGRDVAVAG